MIARLALAVLLLGLAPVVASGATYESLDGAVVFDAEAGTVAVATTDGAAILGPYSPPAPFVLDGLRLEVACRDGEVERSVTLEGPVPEAARTFALQPSALAGLPGFDLPECRIRRNYLISDATGPFPQANLELVPLVPHISTPRERFSRKWRGIGDQARITIGGTRIVVNARGTTYAAWTDEGLGGNAFIAVCDIGSRRVVARFPHGLGRTRRAARPLRAVTRPAAGHARSLPARRSLRADQRGGPFRAGPRGHGPPAPGALTPGRPRPPGGASPTPRRPRPASPRR